MTTPEHDNMEQMVIFSNGGQSFVNQAHDFFENIPVF